MGGGYSSKLGEILTTAAGYISAMSIQSCTPWNVKLVYETVYLDDESSSQNNYHWHWIAIKVVLKTLPQVTHIPQNAFGG